MPSYDSRVQLTSKAALSISFWFMRIAHRGKSQSPNHLRKLGDFDFSEICISSMEVRGDALLLNPDGTKCLIFEVQVIIAMYVFQADEQ